MNLRVWVALGLPRVLKYPSRTREGPVNTSKVEKILGPSAPTAPGFQTVREAADELGVSPWDVMRLIAAGAVQSLVLVDSASIEAMKEKS